MMRNAPMRTVLLVGFVLAAACSEKKSDCSVAVGTCNEGSIACGVQLGCDGRRLELKCTPPPPNAKTMECQCVENSVLGKKVEVEAQFADPEKTAKTACGW